MLINNTPEFAIPEENIGAQELKEQENAQEIEIQNYNNKYFIFKILNIALYSLKMILINNDNYKNKLLRNNILLFYRMISMTSIITIIIVYIISINIISSNIFNILNTDLNNYSITFNAKKTYYIGLVITIIFLIILIYQLFREILIINLSNIITIVIQITISLIRITMIIYFLKTLFNKKNFQYIYDNYSIWRIILIFWYIMLILSDDNNSIAMFTSFIYIIIILLLCLLLLYDN